jgi:hypothetical protein
MWLLSMIWDCSPGRGKRRHAPTGIPIKLGEFVLKFLEFLQKASNLAGVLVLNFVSAQQKICCFNEPNDPPDIAFHRQIQFIDML